MTGLFLYHHPSLCLWLNQKIEECWQSSLHVLHALSPVGEEWYICNVCQNSLESLAGVSLKSWQIPEANFSFRWWHWFQTLTRMPIQDTSLVLKALEKTLSVMRMPTIDYFLFNKHDTLSNPSQHWASFLWLWTLWICGLGYCRTFHSYFTYFPFEWF